MHRDRRCDDPRPPLGIGLAAGAICLAITTVVLWAVGGGRVGRLAVVVAVVAAYSWLATSLTAVLLAGLGWLDVVSFLGPRPYGELHPDSGDVTPLALLISVAAAASVTRMWALRRRWAPPVAVPHPRPAAGASPPFSARASAIVEGKWQTSSLSR
jgi:hypothetical protein